MKKALDLSLDDFDKLLQASLGKNGYVVMPLGLGREKLFFSKS